PEPPHHVSKLRVDLVRQRHRARLEAHAADGARAGRIPDDLWVHRADVLRLYHRRAEIRRLEGHPAVRTAARLRPSDLGMHRAGVRRRPDLRLARCRLRRADLRLPTVTAAREIGRRIAPEPLATAGTPEGRGSPAV